jgi:Protein of unknown function (DUF2630)
MANPPDDEQVQALIDRLEQEESRLRRDERDAAADDQSERLDADAARLATLRVELDQLWDYLRQRRARRDAGQNPDGAQLRDPGIVERYLG